jgi:ribosome production factor 1
MPMSRFEPSSIKNKIKREEVAQKSKKAKNQLKLQKRLARAKVEANDPAAKKVRLFSIYEILIDTYFQKRLEENVPRTLDNMREFDASILTANPSVSTPNVDGEPSNESQQLIDLETDLSNDPFASYFDSVDDPTIPPKILITTSPKASKSTYDFCDELVGVFPGAEFIRRKKGKGFEVGRIAGWAADRGYKHLCVVNEDMKKPSQ